MQETDTFLLTGYSNDCILSPSFLSYERKIKDKKNPAAEVLLKYIHAIRIFFPMDIEIQPLAKNATEKLKTYGCCSLYC